VAGGGYVENARLVMFNGSGFGMVQFSCFLFI
jgi:hypothetical protein